MKGELYEKRIFLLICSGIMMASFISTVNATTEIDFTYQKDNYFPYLLKEQ